MGSHSELVQIPLIILDDLEIRQWQKKEIGRGLLKDAVLRTIKAAKHAGKRASQRIDEETKAQLKSLRDMAWHLSLRI